MSAFENRFLFLVEWKSFTISNNISRVGKDLSPHTDVKCFLYDAVCGQHKILNKE